MNFWNGLCFSFAIGFAVGTLVDFVVHRNVGTKSVLFGAHCFFIHPWFVARAWWKLYGFPIDPRLWVAFFVHDLGYIGKPNMDGPEGEDHVRLGAKIMGWLFDYGCYDSSWFGETVGKLIDKIAGTDNSAPSPKKWMSATWYCFSFYHSRFMAKRYGAFPSMLCYADKLSIALTPAWLYLPMTRWTGEIKEYLARAENGKYTHMSVYDKDVKVWYQKMQDYLYCWAYKHKNGEPDLVTEVTK